MTKQDHIEPQKALSMLGSIYKLLEPDDLEELSHNVVVKRYRKGEIVYRKGELAESFLALVHGRIKIYREGLGGRCIINRVLRSTQYFGYRAAMADEPYVTSASAIEDCTLVALSMASMKRVMLRNNRLCLYFIQALATDLGIADRRIVSLTQKHVRGRLAETILSLIDIYGTEANHMTIDAVLTREDLAALSNMTTSNAIRTLSNFASEGMIAIEGKKIRVIDRVRLRTVSEMG